MSCIDYRYALLSKIKQAWRNFWPSGLLHRNTRNTFRCIPRLSLLHSALIRRSRGQRGWTSSGVYNLKIRLTKTSSAAKRAIQNDLAIAIDIAVAIVMIDSSSCARYARCFWTEIVDNEREIDPPRRRVNTGGLTYITDAGFPDAGFEDSKIRSKEYPRNARARDLSLQRAATRWNVYRSWYTYKSASLDSAAMLLDARSVFAMLWRFPIRRRASMFRR